MRDLLFYFQYWDEVLAAGICFWCLNKMTYMQWSRTACVDILSIVLLGGGAMSHALSPLYGPSLEINYGDPMLWTGLTMWVMAPSIRKWASNKHYYWLLRLLSHKDSRLTRN